MQLATSTVDRRRLLQTARSACRAFGLREPRLRVVGSAHNLVARVAARRSRGRRVEQYALRLHVPDWHSDAVIRSELVWLDNLRRTTDVLVPEPIATPAGDWLVRASDDRGDLERACTLLRWISGTRYWRRPSARWIRAIGRTAAELRSHGERFERPAGFERPRREAADIIGRRGRLAPAWDRLPTGAARVLAEVRDRFEEAADEVGTAPDAFGLVHGDLHVANALSVGGRVAVVDFDDCGDTYQLFDIAAHLDLLEFRENYAELRAAYLAGYAEVRPLPPEHLALVNDFLAARWLRIVLYFAAREGGEERLTRLLDILLPKFRRYLRDPQSLGGADFELPRRTSRRVVEWSLPDHSVRPPLSARWWRLRGSRGHAAAARAYPMQCKGLAENARRHRPVRHVTRNVLRAVTRVDNDETESSRCDSSACSSS